MKKKICGIYGIFNKDTQECLYIGQSKDILTRFSSHLKLLNSGRHLRKNFIEWFNLNKDKLEFKIIEECSASELILNTLEIKWFEEYKPKFYGNIPSKNNTWNHSVETKEKISNTLKNPNSLINRKLNCKYCKQIFQSKNRLANYCSHHCATLARIIILNDLEQKICQSYIDGKSLRECEKLYNISYVKIRSILISNNIPRRSK